MAAFRRQFQVSVFFAACLLLINVCTKNSTTRRTNGDSGPRKFLRIEPTWETSDNHASAKTSEAYPVWSLLGVGNNDERTIVLRVIFQSGRSLQEGVNGTNNDNETNNDTVAEELAVMVSFEDIYKTIVFVATAWLLGSASVKAGMPSLVGEIVTGFLLGPPLADFCPFPEAMVLIGSFGLIGLILESGIDIDVAQLKETGKRAVLMAFTGTTVPLIVGLALGIAAGEDMKSAIAIGACFAPSSLGVAANVLQSGEILNTPVGQMIVASSVVDDVLGLILLSILEVFLNPDPKPFDFILPFLSSFGYLIVLGYSGITWLPHLIEKKIMPYFSEPLRDLAAFSTMFLLLIVYMPLLNYSGASYLTGAFLAGLPFSQIHVIHASFKSNTGHVLSWLLRVFFAATIGFQVPITKFSDPYVLRWGAKFIAPVLAKLPLGFFLPRSQHKLADDFPYDPYKRDFLITSLSVICRGEFNFIIASFALAEGLIGSELYSSVVFAVLLSSIFGPLLLAQVIHRYNKMSKAYVDGNHPIERIGDTCDGYRPLFLAIQARTPVHWGLQDTFKRALEKVGLIILDHRSWHSLGVDSVDITELFVQDTKVKVKIDACFSPLTLRSITLPKDAEKADTGESPANPPPENSVENFDADELQTIKQRSEEVREALVRCLKSDSPDDYQIQVSQWEAFVFEDKSGSKRDRFFTFHSQMSHVDLETASVDVAEAVTTPDEVLSVPNAAEPHLSQCDLWDEDQVSHDVAREGFVLSPDAGGHGGYDIVGGCTAEQYGEGSGHHRRTSSALSLVLYEEAAREIEAEMLKQRLHGYVRQSSTGQP